MLSYQGIERSYLNEEALMADFHQGGEQSFRYIFDMTVGPLTYFVENIVHSKLEAEDIVANSFSKLYNGRKKMVSLEHARRSLYVMAKNESIDLLRRRSLHRQTKEEIAYLAEEIEGRIDTERVQAELIQMIVSEIEELAPQRKKILKLFFFEHKNTIEIARMMGLNTQTVLNHKTKALEVLRRKVPYFSKMSTLTAILYSIGRMYFSS